MNSASSGKRLGEAVKRRRLQVSRGQERKEFIARSGIGDRTLQAVEYAERDSFTKSTKYRLEDALFWERGSVDRILEGGDPVELPLPTPEQAPLSKLGTPELVARISEGLMELARRVPAGPSTEVDDYVPYAPARYDATAPVDEPLKQRRA